ncbi:unnamed protein product [Mesocestoides corti]|uniref:Uncharacterized protein n=1 Tax=Mesocestoides corti TaxID=53468 RepID=A0A0R3U827_MESCO|nr:unnamed protein product [Mesocestoides corti]
MLSADVVIDFNRSPLRQLQFARPKACTTSLAVSFSTNPLLLVTYLVPPPPNLSRFTFRSYLFFLADRQTPQAAPVSAPSNDGLTNSISTFSYDPKTRSESTVRSDYLLANWVQQN